MNGAGVAQSVTRLPAGHRGISVRFPARACFPFYKWVPTGSSYSQLHKVSGYEAVVSPASNAGLGMEWVIPSLLYTPSQRGA